jgi:hypothetical protein
MPLRITHRKEEDVPARSPGGTVSQELRQLEDEMLALGYEMVLEIETGSEMSIRKTKRLVTRAAKRIERPFVHWHSGTKVFAKPAAPPARRRASLIETSTPVMHDQQHVHPTDQQDRRGNHPR